jgi:superfamily I DNA and/or RNA helicase
VDTGIKRKIEKLKHLLWLEKMEDDSFFAQQFSGFSLSKIEKAAKEGICWYPLLFDKKIRVDEEKFKVTFRLPQNMEDEHSFQPGSSVKIFHADVLTGSIIHFTEGVIDLIHKNKVDVSYSDKKTLHWMEEEEGIGIHLSFSKYTYAVMEKALDDISKANGTRLEELRDILKGKQMANFVPCNPYCNEWLNPSQQEAVNQILSSKDVALVHGPPGTGKTTTLVEAIIETLKTERQIMVCAYNNIAVDVIAEKLMERGISVVRIGNPAKVTDELLNVTYEAMFYGHPFYPDILSCKAKIKQLYAEYSKISSKSKSKRYEINSQIREYKHHVSFLEMNIKSTIFRNSQVVAATMIGASFKVLADISFSTIFIDEAAQALEPACWVPIAKASRVIFAGDHQQLPPTIKSYEAAQAGLSNTLFEKIIERNPECSTLLTTQYRMHETIMNFSSQWFYAGRLVASPTVKNRMLIDNDIPIEWIDTSQCKFHENRQNRGTSIFNEDEAHLLFLTLFDYMEKLGEPRILDERITIGVISPYSAQVNLFRNRIKEYHYFDDFLSHKLISMKTIDGFQGQERDIIAISLVRSNRESRIGFLSDYRRINVAMTRARKKLLLIGDSSTLCEDPFFEALFLYVQQNGLVKQINCTFVPIQ